MHFLQARYVNIWLGDTVFENTSIPLYSRLNGFIDLGLYPRESFKPPPQEKYLQATRY